MFVRKVRVPVGPDLKGVVELIELLCTEEGLELRIRRPLRTLPGSIHWHWGRKSSTGTLEITFLPGEATVRLSVHANRVGPWTRETAIRLSQLMKMELGKLAHS